MTIETLQQAATLHNIINELNKIPEHPIKCKLHFTKSDHEFTETQTVTFDEERMMQLMNFLNTLKYNLEKEFRELT